MDPHDVAAIEAVAADYIEGWYRGDEARMDRALHDALVKRIMVPDEAGGDRQEECRGEHHASVSG